MSLLPRLSSIFFILCFSSKAFSLDSIQIGERISKVYLPQGYTSEKTWPLLLSLHGYGSSSQGSDSYLKLSQKLSALGFILILADGTENSEGKKFWNATEFCCDFENSQVDDVSYLSSVIKEAKKRYQVAEDRIYAFGHSNGGFMALTLACKSELFSGVISLAGSTFLDPSNCHATRPVSVLLIHGTKDRTILFEGSEKYPSAADVLDRWARQNNCQNLSEESGSKSIIAFSDKETDEMKWAGCEDNTEVALWKVNGIGHIPMFKSNFIEEMSAFLDRPSR